MDSHNTPLKILMYSTYLPPQYSGAALQAICLAQKLRERGMGVTFLTVNHDNLPPIDEIRGMKVYRIREGKGKFGELILWKNMWKFLNQNKDKIDIIHSHGAYLRNSFVGPLAKLRVKKSLIKVSLAANDLHGLGIGKSGWLHKRFISMVDRYVSISKEITEEFKRYRFSEKKIREIPNGVDTERFSPVSLSEKIVLRKKNGLPKDGLMLLYVGGISSRKNVKWLIETWNQSHKNYPGFLVTVGPVSREDRDMMLFNSLKAYEDRLKGKFFIVEYTEKIEDFYKMTDIFILPSTNEGMPNVVLEAMSSGIPCLVNKISGVEDLINGENGLLFDVQIPGTFLNGLHKLKVESVRSEMSRKAREVIINKFSIENIAERYIDLYEEMLKG